MGAVGNIAIGVREVLAGGALRHMACCADPADAAGGIGIALKMWILTRGSRPQVHTNRTTQISGASRAAAVFPSTVARAVGTQGLSSRDCRPKAPTLPAWREGQMNAAASAWPAIWRVLRTTVAWAVQPAREPIIRNQSRSTLLLPRSGFVQTHVMPKHEPAHDPQQSGTPRTLASRR